MGILQLWEVLKPAFSDRITIDKFAANFVSQHGRPPRLAIDASLFIVLSTLNEATVERIGTGYGDRTIRNFMAKILYLVALNISFVVVFDGKFKPDKRRNGTLDLTRQPDYDEELSFFLQQPSQYYAEGWPQVEAIKRILHDLKIDYLQSPGEGEAQCAFLQKFGIVDHVLSNDLDVFVFGATSILKNYSRFQEDLAGSPGKGNAPSPTSKYWVTPISMSRVQNTTGLTLPRLILLASLRGNDYSTGGTGMGIKNACSLALCGASYAPPTDKNPETDRFAKLPDFSEQLITCFVKPKSSSIVEQWKLILDKETRRQKLEQFYYDLNYTIAGRSKDIFGRRLNMDKELVIDEYYTLVFLFPFVNPELYKFLPQSLSFGELKAIENDVAIPHTAYELQPQQQMEVVKRLNSTVENETVFGTLHLLIIKNEGTTSISQLFERTTSISLFSPILDIPRNYNWNAKYIILKLISYSKVDDTYVSELVNISKPKTDDGIDLLMLRFDFHRLGKVFPDMIEVRRLELPAESTDDFADIEDVPSPSKSKSSSYIWIPRILVEAINKQLISDFERLEAKKKASPKKKAKYSPQKSTLDSFGLFTQKSKGPSDNADVEMFVTEPNTAVAAGKTMSVKRLPVKRRKSSKKELETGQKSLDIFFHKKPVNDNPFLESTEVPDLKLSASKEDVKQERQTLTNIPVLKPIASKLKIPSSSRPSTHESGSPVKRKSSSGNHNESPTKRVNLDDETSPFKIHSLNSDTSIPSLLQHEVSPLKRRNRGRLNEVVVIESDDDYLETSSLMEISPDQADSRLTSRKSKDILDDIFAGKSDKAKLFLDNYLNNEDVLTNLRTQTQELIGVATFTPTDDKKSDTIAKEKEKDYLQLLLEANQFSSGNEDSDNDSSN